MKAENLCACGDDKERCQIIPGLCRWHALAREYFHTINFDVNAEVMNKLANLLRATYRSGLNSGGETI
jgi:hypothetical protein